MDFNLIGRELIGLVVVFLMLGCFWLWMRRNNFSHVLPVNGMHLVQCLPVGQKERILLLEISQHHIVVGVSPAGMHTLHVIPQPDLEN